jgi:PAS domain S-box-containing protein
MKAGRVPYRIPQFFVKVSGLFSLVSGGAVILGWAAGMTWLTSISPYWVSMKPNTALCVAALGGVLLLASSGGSPERRRVRATSRVVLASLVFLVGLLCLAENATGVNLGIDELLFRDLPGAVHTVAPGRMSPLTALCLVLLGLAGCLRGEKGQRKAAADLLCDVSLVVSFISLLCYLLDVHPERGLGSGTPMALLSAVCLSLLSAGQLFLDPDHGILSYIRSESSAGMVARRLAPAAFIVPPVIAALKLEGDRLRLYEPSFGVLLVASAYCVLLVILVSLAVRAVARIDLATEQARHAQTALGQSEQKFSKAFGSSPMGLVISDFADGRIIDANDAYCRITGFPREELVGRSAMSDLKLYPEPADREALVAVLRAKGSVKDAELRVRARSGRIKTLQVSMASIEIDGENCLLSSVVDITARLRAEQALRESERRYRGLFENMIEGFAYCRMDFDGDEPVDFTYLAVNPAFSNLTGLANATGRKVSEVIPGIRQSDPELFAIYGRVARSGKPERFEMDVKALGQWFSASVYSPQRDDFVAVFDVITERKQAEAEIRALNVELEERVRRRTAELEEANAELEAFSSSVSHDLRSPLRGIDGWSAAIEEEYGSLFDEKGRGYFARVRSESRRMGELIDSLLLLARVGRAEMRLEELDLSELAGTVSERSLAIYPERRISFSIEPGLRAVCDRKLIEVALTDLFDNACKFSSRSESARVEFGRETVDEAQVFFVRDNGAGFDMAYASKLFAPFQRLHKASEFPGTGIGLATVHRIIAKHGGRIWAEARPGEGATFRFTLEANDDTERDSPRRG